MIIESVRSAAVPEEKKPYRKIKVSSDEKPNLPADTIRDAVSTYIREKVNHILRGDCVVEVHWNGTDLQSLHLRSIQPLSPEEVEAQRREAVARISAIQAAQTGTTFPRIIKKVAMPTTLRTNQTGPVLLLPASVKKAPLSSSPSSPASFTAPGSSEAQKRLKVVSINRASGSEQNVTFIPSMSLNGGSVVPQRNQTSAQNSLGQRVQTVISTPQTRQVVTSTSRVSGTVATTVTVTGIRSKISGASNVSAFRGASQIVSTGNPSMVARNSVRLIVPSSSTSCPSTRAAHIVMTKTAPGQPIIRTLMPPTVRRPTIQRFRAPGPTFIPPPGSRIIRMRANRLTRPTTIPTPFKAATPAGDIRPSTTWAGVPSEQGFKIDPTIAPTQTRPLQFSAPEIAQVPHTIAPVMTVRQVATSNSNLSVRVNGSVIRAVPGQVIRRVTGEIVRVLDNGSLEPVELHGQVPPKTIVTSRDEPISLDSDSDDGSRDNVGSTTDSDFEVIRGDISTADDSAHSYPTRLRSGAFIRKIEVHENTSLDFPQSVEELADPSEPQLDSDLFDAELLTPTIDFSEGEPYTEKKIEDFSKGYALPRRKRTGSQLPNFLDAVVLDEDGELRLDPDLYENYINAVAIQFGFIKPRKPAESIAYLFLRKGKPKSQCTNYVPKPVDKSLMSVNVSRRVDHDSSTLTASSESEEEPEPIRKRFKLQDDSLPPRIDKSVGSRIGLLSSPEENSLNEIRERKTPHGHLTWSPNTEKVVPKCGDELSDKTMTELHLYKGVKVPEPIALFEPFVVMDRLRAPRNRNTVHLRGLYLTRSGSEIFEAKERDMFFDLERCLVNPNVKLKFDSLPNPLRPLNDPHRGKLVSMMALQGIPKEPTCSKSVTVPLNPRRIPHTSCSRTPQLVDVRDVRTGTFNEVTDIVPTMQGTEDNEGNSL